ncbi:MAG: acyl-CoA dehydrogenase [Phenylobacterium sp.]|jgi:alkylation response protein AidB-like acyl-CoA dehydrogenase|nr:acyl-CoA dehydrogenase [Phenylobacterium sp.]
MELAWAQEHDQYRERLRAILARELPSNWMQDYAHGRGTQGEIAFSRTFCPKLAAEGLLIPHWPKEYGGQDGDAWEHFILSEEMWTWGDPRGPQYMNVNWIGPTLMKFGSPAQKEEHLTRIANGSVIWCQGFSEPQAGTDLAALRTRATRTNHGYVINGSKIWTSYANGSDWCFLLTRTSDERRAISVFLVPMDTPGIEVFAIPGLVEEGHIHEVFFKDVEVPFSALVGEEGMGWEVVTHALSLERVGIPRYHLGRLAMDAAIGKLKREDRYGDPLMRAAAGRIIAKLEAARMLTYLVVDQRAKQQPANAMTNIARVSNAEAVTDTLNFLMEYAPGCLTSRDDPYLTLFYRYAITNTIASGAYELQLNMIAQRALNLPRERRQ